MAWRYRAAAWEELACTASRRRLVRGAARYVPALTTDDVIEGPAGVRAQAVGRDGRLLDDFAFAETGAALHVRNAPSPAATSAFAIAREVADRFDARWGASGPVRRRASATTRPDPGAG